MAAVASASGDGRPPECQHDSVRATAARGASFAVVRLTTTAVCSFVRNAGGAASTMDGGRARRPRSSAASENDRRLSVVSVDGSTTVEWRAGSDVWFDRDVDGRGTREPTQAKLAWSRKGGTSRTVGGQLVAGWGVWGGVRRQCVGGAWRWARLYGATRCVAHHALRAPPSNPSSSLGWTLDKVQGSSKGQWASFLAAESSSSDAALESLNIRGGSLLPLPKLAARARRSRLSPMRRHAPSLSYQEA